MGSGGCPTLAVMSPEPPGVAAPEDPAVRSGSGDVRPRFSDGVERVEPSDGAPARHAVPVGADDRSVPIRRARIRARKVRRIVRHIDPWSVLKISVLFFLSMFLIICVASTVLWNAARTAGTVDSVESFITSLGFGNCENIAGGQSTPAATTTSTINGTGDQLGSASGSSSTTAAVAPPPAVASTLPNKDGKCAAGQTLVGGFKFKDRRIFEAFALGGVVLVLAGAASSVVMALLFNLISDLTGGVRVTVLEEEAPPRQRAPGSPDRRARG